MPNPMARCLDISRLLSRVGRGLTGVDRVELAYLDALLAQPVPLFGLAIVAGGYVLLDKSGLETSRDLLAGQKTPGAPDLVARLSRRLSESRKRAESDLRRAALARSPRFRLGAMLARHLPSGTAYLNVGHSNLTSRVLGAVRQVPNSQITVLVHDLIPLKFPELQRPGTVEVFEAKMRRVAQQADRIIANSLATEAEIRDIFGRWGRLPEIVCAHLGVSIAAPAPLPVGLSIPRPFFVVLGTIEPRKNHALLLDLWEEMGAAAPHLVVAGRRGWNNAAVFDRLDAKPGSVTQLSELTDGQVATLLNGAAGLLMPSLAEGFGLPLVEAAARGTPIVANDLPVYREFLPDFPVYVPVSDRYSWIKEIRRLAKATQADQRTKAPDLTLPTWESHFNRVLSVT